MRAIEAQVGVPLLNRSPRGSQLNQAGVLCAQWAFRVLEAAAELDAGITSLRTDRRSHLRVAASQTVAEHLMPSWLVALQARQADNSGSSGGPGRSDSAAAPGTEIELTATNSEAVLALVLS